MYTVNKMINGGGPTDPAVPLADTNPGGILELSLVNITGQSRAYYKVRLPGDPVPDRQTVTGTGYPIGGIGNTDPIVSTAENPVDPRMIYLALDDSSGAAQADIRGEA